MFALAENDPETEQRNLGSRALQISFLSMLVVSWSEMRGLPEPETPNLSTPNRDDLSHDTGRLEIIHSRSLFIYLDKSLDSYHGTT